MKSKVIFLDRDGVLVQDKGLLSSFHDVHIYDGVPKAISDLRQMGYKIMLISNQTVVSRGILSWSEMLDLNSTILQQIQKENPNAIVDDVYICPHHPKAQIAEYRKTCTCRKPQAGLLLQAQSKHQIDFPSSIMIGDRLTDVYAGKSVGCQGYLIQTGKHLEPFIETSIEMNPSFLIPDQTFDSLLSAAAYIQGHQ